MRGLVALILAGWALPVAAGEPVRVGVVVLDDGGRVTATAQAGMRVEASRILGAGGFGLEWRSAEGIAPGETFNRLIIVRFAEGGADGVALGGAEGALGSTQISDGRILPFVSIDAERVRTALQRSRLWWKTDEQLGRALGRVLAHELYHALSGSQQHDDEGVAKAALSADELAGRSLHLGAAARARLMEALRPGHPGPR
jgi:hypothetical protein